MKTPSTRSKPASRQNANAGFTLIEMMTVVVIFTVLVAFAIPGYRSLVEQYRVNGRLTALESSLAFAQSEATRRRAPVKLVGITSCPLHDGSPQTWSCGWEIVATEGGVETVLRTEDADVRVLVAAAQPVAFTQFGIPKHTGNHIKVAPLPDGMTSPRTKQLCLSSGGRIKRTPEGGAC